MKMLLQTIGALVLIIGGIYVMYMFIEAIDSHSNVLLLIGSLLMLTGGVFLLIRAGKADTIILGRTRSLENNVNNSSLPDSHNSQEESTLEKNNAMLADWKKTNDTKDRLRLLEIQAAEEVDSKS